MGDKIAEQINKDLKKIGHSLPLNLASQEYFKAAGNSNIDAQIISPSFLDEKNGKYKIISFYAKKSQGKYGKLLITNRIENPDDIVQFDHDGYKFAKGKVHQINQYARSKTTGSRLKKNLFSKETDFLFLLALCNLDCTDFLCMSR